MGFVFIACMRFDLDTSNLNHNIEQMLQTKLKKFVGSSIAAAHISKGLDSAPLTKRKIVPQLSKFMNENGFIEDISFQTYGFKEINKLT